MTGVERTTDYEAELGRIEGEIAELAPTALSAPIDIEAATRFVYRRYQRASLTGSLPELDVAKAEVDAATREFGTWSDLCMLRALIDFKLHRNAAVRRDLEMAPGLAESPQGRALAADLELQEGRYEAARRGYEAVIERERSWDNLARLAHLEAKLGDFESADRLYIEAEDEITAKQMRSFAWVELQRGLLGLSVGDYGRALTHYARAEQAYSGFWLVDQHLAQLLAAQGRLDEALALYEAVVVRTSKPELQQALGDLYLATGSPERARHCHDKALAAYLQSARRGDVHYFHHLVEFYADVVEDGAEAVRWARKDLELRPNPSTHAALAWALYRDGRFDSALDAVQTALSFGVREAQLLFRAGTIHQAAGQAEAGQQLLDDAAEINPRHERLHVPRPPSDHQE